VGVRGDDRLAALAHEAAPDPVDVERRTRAAPLQRAESDLTDEHRHADPLAVLLVIERQLGDVARSSSESARTAS
jgi:hypothetical protein